MMGTRVTRVCVGLFVRKLKPVQTRLTRVTRVPIEYPLKRRRRAEKHIKHHSIPCNFIFFNCALIPGITSLYSAFHFSATCSNPVLAS